jgi:hypothetical protein
VSEDRRTSGPTPKYLFKDYAICPQAKIGPWRTRPLHHLDVQYKHSTSVAARGQAPVVKSFQQPRRQQTVHPTAFCDLASALTQLQRPASTQGDGCTPSHWFCTCLAFPRVTIDKGRFLRGKSAAVETTYVELFHLSAYNHSVVAPLSSLRGLWLSDTPTTVVLDSCRPNTHCLSNHPPKASGVRQYHLL